LFNWLFARHLRGAFLLRIEDTDRDRSTDEAIHQILDAMTWLGLDWDREGPEDDGTYRGFFRQTSRFDIYRTHAERLLAEGRAYRCYCTPEELDARREAAQARGETFRYDGRCRNLPLRPGAPAALRLRIPDSGTTVVPDLVHGDVTFDRATLDDWILVRSDGTPTYNFCVVVDDVTMKITHVIRGNDHLSNTPKQILIYQGLSRTPPVFAHLPLIFGTDKKRLSKRHGATSVLDYRDAGFLPEAMFNFLTLLGWNPGDARQKMSRDELIDAFDLSGVGKSGAVFDLTKLTWLNGLYIDAMSAEAFAAAARGALTAAGLWDDAYEGPRRDWFRGVLALIQPRARTLAGIAEEGRYFFVADGALSYDPDAVKKHLSGDAIAPALRALLAAWEALPDWAPVSLEAELRRIATDLGLAAGKLIHPVRLAVTGRAASPGLFEVVQLLGRAHTLARLNRLLDRLSSGLL
jgi:glutamyl-tRNA synthetase